MTTHIDELINYKETISNYILNDQVLMGLVFDDPDIDLDDDRVYNAKGRNIFTHSYCDDVVQIDNIMILIESMLIKAPYSEINRYEVEIQIICGKNYMDLDAKKFKGYRGSRRDNIIRCIDLLLKDERLGIGKLKLNSCVPVDVPKGFSSMMMVYSSEDYSKNRRIF